MRRRARIAPFEICIPSAIDSPNWEDEKKAAGDKKRIRIRRLIPWVFTISALVFLSIELMSLYGPGLDLHTEDVKRKTQPQETSAFGWKREGSDMGMVLLDIPTRQAALAFHVPGTGVYVLAVANDSPADLAGAQPGDRIAGVGGVAIDGLEELTAALGSLKSGETVELTILRGMEKLTLSLEAEADMEQL